MSSSTAAAEYRGPDIPTPLGGQLRVALGLDERPETFGDWVDALAFFAERDEVSNRPRIESRSPHHDVRRAAAERVDEAAGGPPDRRTDPPIGVL